MKTRLLVIAWIILGAAAAIWHFGPGQSWWLLNVANRQAKAAEEAAARGDWQDATDRYMLALASVPADEEYSRNRLAIAHAVARTQVGQLVEAQEELEAVVAKLANWPAHEAADLLTSARNELGTASYHAAWLMRLEGATPDEWKVETERARQQFRLLAEEAAAAGDDHAAALAENLEATIKLEQMDLSTLMARPLPKKCPSCCRGLSQRKRRQCQSQCQQASEGKGKEKAPQDVRQQVKHDREAGLAERGPGGS